MFYRVVVWKSEGEEASLGLQSMQRQLADLPHRLFAKASHAYHNADDHEDSSISLRKEADEELTWSPQKWSSSVKVYLKKQRSEDTAASSLSSRQTTVSSTNTPANLLFVIGNSTYRDSVVSVNGGDGLFVETGGYGFEQIVQRLTSPPTPLLQLRQTIMIEGFEQRWPRGWVMRYGVVSLGGSSRAITLQLQREHTASSSSYGQEDEEEQNQEIFEELLEGLNSAGEYGEERIYSGEDGESLLSQLCPDADDTPRTLSPSIKSAFVTLVCMKNENLINL